MVVKVVAAGRARRVALTIAPACFVGELTLSVDEIVGTDARRLLGAQADTRSVVEPQHSLRLLLKGKLQILPAATYIAHDLCAPIRPLGGDPPVSVPAMLAEQRNHCVRSFSSSRYVLRG